VFRRPLSTAEEEPHFLAADAGRERFRDGMKAHVLSRFAAHGQALKGSVFDLGVYYGSPSVVRVVSDARAGAVAWTGALYPEDLPAQKARKPTAGVSEAELIEAALDAGMELGLQTLPARARKAVDVGAARKVARQRLRQGSFRKNLAALEESQRGLAVLLNASRDPALTVLKDSDRLAQAFGLNSRQAATIVRETRALVEAGKKTDAIKRAMKKRVRQALEARAEALSEALGSEAINESRTALWEQAKKQGLLEDKKDIQEWVLREGLKHCPICGTMAGQRRKIGEAFISPHDGSSYRSPPVHNHCGCQLIIVKPKSAKIYEQ